MNSLLLNNSVSAVLNCYDGKVRCFLEDLTGTVNWISEDNLISGILNKNKTTRVSEIPV